MIPWMLISQRGEMRSNLYRNGVEHCEMLGQLFGVSSRVFRLKASALTNIDPTGTGGRSRWSVSANASSERKVPSNTPTSMPRAFKCDDRYNAKRRMRPHHALLFGIEREKVGVGQQQIHHDTCCGGRMKSTITFSTGIAYQS